MARGKGEGSIYKRADGRWVGSIALEPAPDGKRRRSVFYGRSRREVLVKLDKARAGLADGLEPVSAADRRVTVGELLTEWLDSIQRPHSEIKELTQGQYVVAANTRVRPQLGNLPVARLDHDRLVKWQDELLDRYAPRSVLKARVVLNAVITIARRKRLLRENPLELVPSPQTAKPRKRAISGEEAGRLLRAVRGHRFETALLADLLLGTRRGELLGWTWDDIDMDAATIRMRQQLQRLPRKKGKHAAPGRLVLVQPKTDAGNRVVPLPSLLVERLRAHQAEQIGERDRVLKAGKRWKNTDPLTARERLVFVTSIGTPIEPRKFNTVFNQVIAAAGLAPLTPHELRHSMATILQALGVPPVVVSQLLGHADPSVTLRWYSHDIPEAHREAMARMDEYIRRVDEEHTGVDGHTNGYTSSPDPLPPSSNMLAGRRKDRLSQS